jgi:replicative DNA helicase
MPAKPRDQKPANDTRDIKMPDGKIPPQNIDAETSILGAVLIDEDVLTRVSDKLVADDFYDKRHALIYGAMVSLYEHHNPVDLLTLSDELKKRGELENAGGSEYLTELTNQVPTAAHAESYADIITQNAMRRRLIRASGNIAELGFDGTKTSEELLADAEAQLFAVSDQALRQELTSLEQILTESFDRMEELHRDKSKMRGVPTGYRDMDTMLAGLQRSDLIILAARPAMGKSTFALNLAHNIAVQQKQSVLVFSLEMSKEQLVDRMLADEAGVDAWNIRTGNLSDDDFEKLSHAMGVLAEAPIFIDDTPGLSVLEMRTKARRAAHERPLGLIVVDYLQLMSGSAKSFGDNRVQEISEISRGLKLVARELNVPVLALSQLSRSVESRTPPHPQLSDLRESGSIEQDADIVMFLYREDYYNPETDRQHVTDVMVKKHRNGPVGNVELYFHPERLKFLSLDKHHE